MYLPTARARIGIFADNVGEIREALSSTHAVISVVRKAVRMFPTKHEVQHTISASVSLATRKRPRLAAVHTLLTIAPLPYFCAKTARRTGERVAYDFIASFIRVFILQWR